LVLTAGSADALSCLRPNIARTFNDLSASDRSYFMALGHLEQTGKRIPMRSDPPKVANGEEQPVLDIGIPHEVPARFSGKMFGATGLSDEITLDLKVDEICLASWCGSFPETDDEILVFIERTEVDYRLRSGPCEGDFKVAPTEAELALLQSCLKAGQCSKAQVNSL
jgi:hypothetical protein